MSAKEVGAGCGVVGVCVCGGGEVCDGRRVGGGGGVCVCTGIVVCVGRLGYVEGC